MSELEPLTLTLYEREFEGEFVGLGRGAIIR